MTGFSLLGALALASVLAVGVYWLLTNITLKGQNPYEYKKDENGNEYVKDNTNEKARKK